MLKYLRIAVTVLSLTACVLLFALWVRSYSWTDIYGKRGVASSQGKLHKFRALSLIPIQRRDPPTFGNLSGIVTVATDRVEIVQANAWAVVPFWVSVLSALALAVAPWIRWRFSLRTLLIATTLVAAVLGLIVAAR